MVVFGLCVRSVNNFIKDLTITLSYISEHVPNIYQRVQKSHKLYPIRTIACKKELGKRLVFRRLKTHLIP